MFIGAASGESIAALSLLLAFTVFLLLIVVILWRLSARLFRFLAAGAGNGTMDAPSVLIGLGIAAWLFPDVVRSLWNLFLGILQVLLVDAPRIVFSQISNGICLRSEDCFQSVLLAFGASSFEFAQSLLSRSGLGALDLTRLIIAAAVMAVVLLLIRQITAGGSLASGALAEAFHRAQSAYRATRPETRNLFALTAVITVAAYLSIAAIAAVSLFTPGPPIAGLAPADLEARLTTVKIVDTQAAKPFSDRYPENIAVVIPPVAAPDGSAATSPFSSEDYKFIRPRLEQDTNDSLHAYATLRSIVISEQERLGSAALAQYEVRNFGRLGGREQANHFLALYNWYSSAVRRMFDDLDTCRGATQAFASAVNAHATNLIPPQSKSENRPDRSFEAGQIIFEARAEVEGRCRARSVGWSERLPDRESFGGYLGPVGYASSWILATESESVALIIGLVGFGLFGALVSSFIRTDRNRSRRHNFLSIICIGISAAIVVFLASYAGIAIVAETEVTTNPIGPNPYQPGDEVAV